MPQVLWPQHALCTPDIAPSKCRDLPSQSDWCWLQVWRLVTPFLFIGKPSFKVLIEIVWVVTYGKQLEQGVFQFSTADFVSVRATCLSALACSWCAMGDSWAAPMSALLVLAG